MKTVLPERNLDLLRAIAVLCVVADHTTRLFTDHIGPIKPYQFGLFGVYVFFVHTSLVLMSSLERQGTGPTWVRDFYVRRAFRIYPLAIAAIIVVITCRVPFFLRQIEVATPFQEPSSLQILGNVTLTQNVLGVEDVLAPLWSLPIEVQMYLLLPALYLLARKNLRGLLVFSVIGLALSIIEWRVRLYGLALPLLWRFTLLAYIPCFACGVLAYAAFSRRPRWQAQLPAWTFPIALTMALGVLVVSLQIAGRTWAWLACLVVATSLVCIREVPASIMTRLAKTIATYSYGVYLTHALAIYWGLWCLRDYPLPLRITAFLGLFVLLPWIGYHAVEAPGIALGQALVRRRAAATPAPVRN